MTTLLTIDTAAAKLRSARNNLADIKRAMDEEIVLIATAYRSRIKTACETVQERQAWLHAQIADAPDLFKKPKTRVMHGITLGYEKGKGKIIIADPARTLGLIDKHLPDQRDLLIITEERPNKNALKELAVADLKKIGCTIEDTGEHIVIRAAASDIDKLIDAMLQEKSEGEQAA